MLKRIALWAIPLSVVAASSSLWTGAATLRFQESAASEAQALDALNDCPSEFNGFRHAVTWYAGGKRLLIEANQACGDRLGHTYDLKNVTMSILSGNTVVAKLESPSAVYSLVGNKIILGESVENQALRCVGNLPLVAIDLASSEVRMPGHRFLLNDDRPIPCEKSAGT